MTVQGGTRVPATARPAGQTRYGATRAVFARTPALTAADMVATIPGVSAIAGNGPRDTAISVRGSDARQTFGLRNLQVLEDGFPMTQPDGLARSDLIDPHAYASLDVVQGPSSTIYGNYAVDGALLFHTRDGADIQGIELGSDFGSYGLFNQYVSAGGAGRWWDLSVFGSDVRGDGFIRNSRFDTSTENVRLRISLSPRDRLVFKVVNNRTDTRLPLRLSLDQFGRNPFQRDCGAAVAAGCGSVSLFRNGAYGATVATTADAADLGRFDRRTIVGMRWEHDLADRATWRTQFAYDERDIDQPTSNTSFVGVYDSYNVSSDLTADARPWGVPVRSFAGLNFNYLDLGSQVYNITPLGGATIGAPTQLVYGHQWNAGARFQEEIRLAARWKLVLGLGGEYSDLGATETILGYTATSATRRFVTANRFYFNLAPEGSLIYTPDQHWTLHTRVGTGYGTPQTSNLFVTPAGVFGNNAQLESQSNVGVDVGAEWHPSAALSLQATLFYEFFRNELVTQSAGVNLQSYTFNAPASEHRGVELGADWHMLPRALPGAHLLLSYTYDNQIYTRYSDVLTGGGTSATFDRAGNAIPGVVPNQLDLRLLYDQPDGRLEGVGGFVEFNFRDAYWLDNANLLRAPSAGLLNLELHYDPPRRMGAWHRLHLFCEIENLANRTYVASAANIADGLGANGAPLGKTALAGRTGSIYAGQPRSAFGGVKVRF
ncbi:TonB-dependent receptor family protein [Rhizosaccharibacter radicis]|uniref:TonB-dependent receptor n=1 Tax=Rhizosaccharibacter radicis TaxID=2782605 RepID=A0ABT1VUL6_9PROT|nr:TonB-dependent receptor [Acetobacteraceae bacterium KSS12]